MQENEIAQKILDAAFRIHRELGPGLLESVYEAILARELTRNGFKVSRQQPIAIRFEGLQLRKVFEQTWW